ncbi:MAG TPA: GNAT family N-acetyltransferase [Anaerolineales bacterium]|nr:GNAT family N-acetyltransferase [Anaerolineales bacterium]
MSITLRELTRATWEECVDLDVAEDQQDFVSSNLVSLAEAQFYPGTVCRAVYAGDVMVGFVMYGPDAEYAPDEPGAYAFVRLMIDRHHQGQGYGRAAIAAVIDAVRNMPESRILYTSFVPENTHAAHLYQAVGFQPTGRTLDGEIIVALPLKP